VSSISLKSISFIFHGFLCSLLLYLSSFLQVDFFHLPKNLNSGDWCQCLIDDCKNNVPSSLLSYFRSDKQIREVATIGIAPVVNLVDSNLQLLILD